MQQLSPSGQQAIHELAQRHGFGFDAVCSMLDAVIQGNGSMAQFNHPEFSGAGQWMAGGMTMVSDMFNQHLKGRVDSLCSELAQLVSNQPGLVLRGSHQSQSQHSGNSGDWQHQHAGTGQAPGSMRGDNGLAHDSSSLFVPAGPDWWGPDLRWPDSTGAQNQVRYACFSQARRLAIEQGGQVTVYDTLDHQIGGFSQQQSGSGSLGFSSQYGWVDVGSLPVVSVNGMAPVRVTPQAHRAPQGMTATVNTSAPNSSDADVFATLERLADLCNKGVLTSGEYQAKKAELLARL